MSTEELRKTRSAELAVIRTRQSSNTQMFDKAILTLSSAGLGVSLAFIKDIVPLDKAISVWGLKTTIVLYVSWGLFVAAIVTTLYSFIASLQELQKQSKQIDDELAGQTESRPESENGQTTKQLKKTKLLTYFSFGIFIAAIILKIGFIIINCLSLYN